MRVSGCAAFHPLGHVRLSAVNFNTNNKTAPSHEPLNPFLRDVEISTEAYLKTSKYETQERARLLRLRRTRSNHRYPTSSSERPSCRLSSQRLTEPRFLLVILRCCREHTRPGGCLPPAVRTGVYTVAHNAITPHEPS